MKPDRQVLYSWTEVRQPSGAASQPGKRCQSPGDGLWHSICFFSPNPPPAMVCPGPSVLEFLGSAELHRVGNQHILLTNSLTQEKEH